MILLFLSTNILAFLYFFFTYFFVNFPVLAAAPDITSPARAFPLFLFLIYSLPENYLYTTNNPSTPYLSCTIYIHNLILCSYVAVRLFVLLFKRPSFPYFSYYFKTFLFLNSPVLAAAPDSIPPSLLHFLEISIPVAYKDSYSLPHSL